MMQEKSEVRFRMINLWIRLTSFNLEDWNWNPISFLIYAMIENEI